jgi:hypothetical protein
MRTGDCKSGVRSKRRGPRTVLYRANTTDNGTHAITGMKVFEFFLVPWGAIMRSTLFLLASYGRRVMSVGLDEHVVIRVEEVERWIPV